ncbi:hypothetical protein MMC07_000200 [Pseudocyphellaria aurata]|nr:hypothetical protein [Pseudocyphellaria aurata]
MANETMLSYILQSPKGGAQSFLEGLFNPVVQYDEITDCILGQLSNDDTNAMRRTNSTMNNGVMALRDDGIFRHKQETMRDQCDVTGITYVPGISPPQSVCPNTINCSERLRRCTRLSNEPGFAMSQLECHKGIEGFLVCTRCDGHIRDGVFDRDGPWHRLCSLWPTCDDCTRTQEMKYPHGAQLCQCLPEIKRRVLCNQCLRAKLVHLHEETDRYFRNCKWIWRDGTGQIMLHRRPPRKTEIWRDENGRVKFDMHPPRDLPVCVDCCVRYRPFDKDEFENSEITRICLFCRKYNVVPSHEKSVAPVRLPARRSARLKSTADQNSTHIRLSNRGTARMSYTEIQGPHGFSNASPTI